MLSNKIIPHPATKFVDFIFYYDHGFSAHAGFSSTSLLGTHNTYSRSFYLTDEDYIDNPSPSIKEFRALVKNASARDAITQLLLVKYGINKGIFI